MSQKSEEPGFRIALLADVHLGTSESQVPGQNCAFAADLLRDAVALLRPMNVDRLVVVGDLVNMGTSAEYDIAKQILQALALPTTVIPGNHEFIRGTMSDFKSNCVGATLNQADFNREAYSTVYLNSGIEGMTPYHWHGRIEPDGIALLDRATSEHPAKPLLVFVHHPPESTVLLAKHPMMTLLNSDDVMIRLLRHPSPVVLFCGHSHVTDVWRRRDLTIIGCPPLCFWPHAFLIVELLHGILHINAHRLIESPEGSPDPYIRNDGYLNEREPWITNLTVRICQPAWIPHFS